MWSTCFVGVGRAGSGGGPGNGQPVRADWSSLDFVRVLFKLGLIE